MKNFIIILCLLSFSSLSFAENLVLLRKDKDCTSYYETDTIRRTQQLVLVWSIQKREGKKKLEYLTEFDCQMGLYRQISLRGFDENSRVFSSNAIYKKWFDVPNANQVLGILYGKVCIDNWHYSSEPSNYRLR